MVFEVCHQVMECSLPSTVIERREERRHDEEGERESDQKSMWGETVGGRNKNLSLYTYR